MRHPKAFAGILWATNALMIGCFVDWCLSTPEAVWLASGPVLVGMLAWLCAARLVDRAPIVGVTAAVLATVLCAGMAGDTGLGPMVGFVAGMGAGVAIRRWRRERRTAQSSSR